MDQIEAALHNALPPSGSSRLARPVGIMNGGVEESNHPSSDMPFAVVKSIDPNGPAGAAVCHLTLKAFRAHVCGPLTFRSHRRSTRQGLAADDRIVSFGSVNASNHENLRALAALVGKSEGVRSILGHTLPPPRNTAADISCSLTRRPSRSMS